MGFMGDGILEIICGSVYLNWYFTALGCKIGKNVCLYPNGGDPMMTEPDLVTIGNNVCIDNASVIAHINTRGELSLNKLTIEDGCTLKCNTRLLSGAAMEYKSTLLEHTLIIAGSTTDARSEWQGWPGQFKKRGWDNPHTYDGINLTTENLNAIESNKLYDKEPSFHHTSDSHISDKSIRRLSLSLNTFGVAIFGSKTGSEHERLQDESSNEGNDIELTGSSVMDFHNLHVNRQNPDSEEAKELNETDRRAHFDNASFSNSMYRSNEGSSTQGLSINRYLDDFIEHNEEGTRCREREETSWPRNASTSSITGLLDNNESRSEKH